MPSCALSGQPVAKLTAYEAEPARRRRWSAKRHLDWLHRTGRPRAESLPRASFSIGTEKSEAGSLSGHQLLLEAVLPGAGIFASGRTARLRRRRRCVGVGRPRIRDADPRSPSGRSIEQGSIFAARCRVAANATAEPFSLVPFPNDSFEGARALARRIPFHCRTLDLLHLAAMQSIGVTRLLTNDAAQTAVATALGFEVISPVR